MGVFTLGAGMWLYDLLAIFRNIRAHRMLTPKRTLAAEPSLRSQGLRGAALYYDCWTDDARLTLETILAAHQEGAAITNYLELEAFRKDQGRIVGALVRDRCTAASIEVRARCVVNAAGPWADAIRRLDDPNAKACLRLTKGSHIIVPRSRLGIVHAIVIHSPRDQRILFAIPWGAHTLIGTTDTDFDGDIDDVRPTAEDFDYLLEAANWCFPAARLETRDIVGSYAGVRPLVADSDAADPSAVSREELIFEGPSGLVTLAGGKLTTYRLAAEEIVDLVVKRLGGTSSKPCATRSTPLPGGLLHDPEDIVKQIDSLDGCGLSTEQLRRLARRYGSRTPEVVALIRNDSDLKRALVPGMPDTWAEATYAARAEMAIQPDDILMRRTQVGIKDPVESSQLIDLLKQLLNPSSPDCKP